jgi:hypothetical protein
MQTGEIIITMAGVVIVTAALVFYSNRQKKAAWSGQVVNAERYQDADDNDNFVLHVRTDEGKLMKVRMNAYQFGQFRTGDLIVKRAGNPSPVKVPEPAASNADAPAPANRSNGGTILTVACPKCRAAVAGAVVNFCPTCGASMIEHPCVPRVCKQCGNEAFCVKCGNKILSNYSPHSLM